MKARKGYEASGMDGSNMNKLCNYLREELLGKNIDMIEMMHEYDRGNGRVRVAALL